MCSICFVRHYYVAPVTTITTAPTNGKHDANFALIPEYANSSVYLRVELLLRQGVGPFWGGFACARNTSIEGCVSSPSTTPSVPPGSVDSYPTVSFQSTIGYFDTTPNSTDQVGSNHWPDSHQRAHRIETAEASVDIPLLFFIMPLFVGYNPTPCWLQPHSP
jgi:hypothetical protein